MNKDTGIFLFQVFYSFLNFILKFSLHLVLSTDGYYRMGLFGFVYDLDHELSRWYCISGDWGSDIVI